MHNTTFISSMVLSVACVSAANATVVYNTIDPFTESASTNTVNAVTGVNSTLSPSVSSLLTGTLWDVRSIRARTTHTARASASVSIGSSSAVFGVTQVGALNTQTLTQQNGYLDYFTANSQYPDFTNFTSLDFNYTSNFTGTLECRVSLTDAVNYPVVKTMSVGSGSMSFTLADFGGIALNQEAMGPLTIEFRRSGSNASGSLTITNLVANGASIPAPGALALLGAAGLVGARRRRA
jgi:MYXO-CTERM domain-containing protein